MVAVTYTNDGKSILKGRAKQVKMSSNKNLPIGRIKEMHLFPTYLQSKGQHVEKTRNLRKTVLTTVHFACLLLFVSYYVAQHGLELLGSSDPLASALQVARTMGMHHCFQLLFF
jgi:hypothetical protein